MKRRAHAQRNRPSLSTHDSPEADVVPLPAVRKTTGCNAEAVLLIQKAVGVKRIHPCFLECSEATLRLLCRDAENAVCLGQAPESNRAASKGAKSACATSLLTSGQASARAAVGQAPARAVPSVWHLYPSDASEDHHRSDTSTGDVMSM